MRKQQFEMKPGELFAFLVLSHQWRLFEFKGNEKSDLCCAFLPPQVI